MSGFGAVGKSAMRLSYLIANADGTMAQLTDDSLLAQLLAVDGTVADFNDNTDSLEAISNAIGAIPCTDAVAEIGSFTGQTNLQTLLAALGIPDVTAKPLYTCLVPDRLDDATFGLSALHTDIAAIPTTMVGTNSAFLASVGGLLTTAAATGAVDTGTPAMGYIKQNVTNLITIDGFHDVPTADVSTNAQMRDVVGNKTDAAADTADVVSLVGLIRKTLAETKWGEQHHHNFERWFAKKATPTGTRFAEELSVLAAASDDPWTRLTPGNVNVWGADVQIWGTDDTAAILPSGHQTEVDLHRMRLHDAADDKKTYIMQIVTSTTSANDGRTAGTYSELPLFIEKGNKPPDPVDLLMKRISAGTGVWARIMTIDGTSASTLDVQFGIHGYP